MRVVVGTAGHIDHGKTTLLRALTGIDADRLPEEQRRGMTIDVGYAHLDVPGAEPIDFVDVPGHDRLVGNMLVGAGEIDAAMLVIAADEGPQPQTIEHLELLDALGVQAGVIVVTKADLVSADLLRERLEAARSLAADTSLAGSPVLAISAADGAGLEELRAALTALAARVAGSAAANAAATRLPVDRAFVVKGRGAVVTGTLRGGSLARSDELRLEPGGREVRVREVQVHGRRVDAAAGGGRVAVNLAGVDGAALRRGLVLAAPGAVTTTRRLLVVLEPVSPPVVGGRPPEARPLPVHGERLRLHLGTDQAAATVVRTERTSAALASGAATAVLRLDREMAVTFGDRFVLRRSSTPATAAGGRVLDPAPPLGVSRRHAGAAALTAIAEAGPGGDLLAALVRLHGAATARRVAALGPAPEGIRAIGPLLVDPAIAADIEAEAVTLVGAAAEAEPLAAGSPLAALRASVARALRRRATIDPVDAVAASGAVISDLVAAGRLVAAGDRVRLPGQSANLPPEVLASMDRVEAALSVAAPPALSDVLRDAACPPAGLRALETAGRVVCLQPEIAYARGTYARLAGLALRMAAAAPLTPAAYRDATGTSRKYALAILEDLDRRGILLRTEAGHVPGPRAPGRTTRT